MKTDMFKFCRHVKTGPHHVAVLRARLWQVVHVAPVVRFEGGTPASTISVFFFSGLDGNRVP